MASLRDILDEAAAQGLVAQTQVPALTDHLQRRGVRIESTVRPGRPDADEEIVDTEVPRFVRGFHDILITIGVLILLAGVWGLGSGLAILPVIVVLAEILVRRQRLALPAVVLSLATLVWTAFMTMFVTEWFGFEPDGTLALLVLLLPFPLVLGLFYWRYRVPIALAILLLSVFALLLALFFYLLGLATGVDEFAETFPTASTFIVLAAAIGLFGIALSYDLADPSRISRRSDIAFWLHLAAAPALLYAMLAVTFLGSGEGLFLFERVQAYESAGRVLVIVVILMAIGLVMDRRAFVTSGLVSLIAAVGAILGQGDVSGSGTLFIALLVVGVFVLAIGVGWPSLRRMVLGGFPEHLKTKLPPLR